MTVSRDIELFANATLTALTFHSCGKPGVRDHLATRDMYVEAETTGRGSHRSSRRRIVRSSMPTGSWRVFKVEHFRVPMVILEQASTSM